MRILTMIFSNASILKTALFAAAVVLAFSPALQVDARSDRSSRAGAAALPEGLFVDKAPAEAMDVCDARKQAKQGKPITIRGRIGGIAQPIADGYAMFLVIDQDFKLCKDGCADLCHISRDKVTAGMATIQVADASGKPLKASLRGVNGLKPLSKVIVAGEVATVTDNVLIVNAKKIFVAKAQAK